MVVNVSSGLGSFVVTRDPDRIESNVAELAYTSSKTALNMMTTQWAKASPAMRINAVDPGYTATDLNGHSGPQTVERGHRRDGPDGAARAGRSDRHVRRPARGRPLVALRC